MRHFLIRLGLFFAVALGLFTALDQLLLHGLRTRRTHTFGSWNRMVEGRIQAQVLFTGSSRCLMHYDAENIGRRIGRRCYNLGMDGTQLTLQLPWLKTYLLHDRPPELIVQQVDLISLVPDSDIFFPMQYLPYLNEAPIYDAVRKIDRTWWRDRYLPMDGFGRFGLPYAMLAASSLLGTEDTVHDPLRLGHEKRDWKWDGTFDTFLKEHPDGRHYRITEQGIEGLRAIIRTAKEAGSGIALSYAPELRENQVITKNRAEVFAVFERIAREERIPFWDFSDAWMCDERRYFYNSQHMNAAGVDLFTPMVADSIAAWYVGR